MEIKQKTTRRTSKALFHLVLRSQGEQWLTIEVTRLSAWLIVALIDASTPPTSPRKTVYSSHKHDNESRQRNKEMSDMLHLWILWFIWGLWHCCVFFPCMNAAKQLRSVAFWQGAAIQIHRRTYGRCIGQENFWSASDGSVLHLDY